MKISVNNRLVGFTAIILGALILVAIIYFIFFYKFSPAKPVISDQPASIPTSTPAPIIEVKRIAKIVASASSTPGDTAGPASQNDAYQASFGVVADNFAERFGTYSSQSSRMLDDGLKLITTSKMQNWLVDFYRQESAKSPNYKEYSAMTTMAVTNSVESLSESAGRATVMVQTARTEDLGGAVRVFNQSIKVELVRVGQRWKVDAAYWQ